MASIVDRTLEVFEIFAKERQPLLLSDLARLMQIPVSSCHDLVRALQARGYLYELGPRAGYYPTLRLRDLGTDIAESDPVLARARLLLSSLRDALGESVFLAKAQGNDATYLLVFEAKQVLRVMREPGEKLGVLYGKSGGKALLANLDKKSLNAYLQSLAADPNFKSREALLEEIELGRRRGWFVNDGQTEIDLLTVSATFRWSADLYIVTIAAPISRFRPKLDEAANMLTSVCKMLGRGGD